MPERVKCFQLTLSLVQTPLFRLENLHVKQSTAARPFLFVSGVTVPRYSSKNRLQCNAYNHQSLSQFRRRSQTY